MEQIDSTYADPATATAAFTLAATATLTYHSAGTLEQDLALWRRVRRRSRSCGHW